MSIKLVEKHAIAAWSPLHSAKNLIALGSCGLGSGSSGTNGFEGGLDLEIFSLDASGRGSSMSVVGRVAAHSQFKSLGWANIGSSMSLGVIAGGHSDGHVTLWDVSRICSNSPSNQAQTSQVLFRQDLHAGGAVSCLEFNPQKPGLLGTGGADGQVQVLSIERPNHPDIFRGVTTVRHVNSEVTCLAWNRKVQHILATSSNQGLTVIWDLKNKKEVISFKDPANRTRCSAVSWNPETPTQLLVAYNDDTNPCIQMWDMRNCTYPFKEYQEHSRGVTCASFCDLDANLIVSSGRDNRSVCWSTHSGQLEAYADLSVSAPAIKLDWSMCLPGFVAASSASGTVSIHSISQRQTPAAAGYPPKWVRMPCGVSFGFGGKVVAFGSKQGASVQMFVVPDEPAVVGEADRFESFLATDLRPFCAVKIDEAGDEHEKLTWSLMALLFEGPSSRNKIIGAMGIDTAEIHVMAEKYLGRSSTIVAAPSNLAQSKQDHAGEGFGSLGDASNLNPDQLDDLFDQLAKSSEQHQQLASVTGLLSGSNSRRGTPRATPTGGDDQIITTDWSQGPEAIIKQSLLIGDVQAAVECCMKSGRFADGLFLAASGTPELWRHTRDEYARRQKDPFIRLVGFVLADDFEKFVLSSDLTCWVETLAILITHAQEQHFTRLAEMLGERLEKERFDVRSAVLCYLACGSFANAVRIWTSMSNIQGSQSQALQDLVEKMSCLFSAIRPVTTEQIFSHKILQYATLLANSGRIVAAMRCLVLVPDSTESRILKDRIYNAAPSQMGQLVRGPPPFPFEVTDIRPIQAPMPSGPQSSAIQRGGGPMSAGPRSAQPVGHGTPYLASPQQPGGMGGTYASHPPPPSGPASGYGGPSSNVQNGGPYAPPTQGFPVRNVTQPTGPQANHSSVGIPTVVPVFPPTGGSGSAKFGAPPPGPPAPVSQPLPVNRSVPPPSIPVRVQQGNVPIHSPPPGGAVGPQMSHMAPPGAGMAGYTQPHRAGGIMPSPAHPQGAFGANTRSSAPIVPSQANAYQHGGASPNAAGQGNTYQSGYAPPVIGPPTSGGVSTAPHATANPVTPGMPVSWPVPTPIQQGLSANVAVPPPRAPMGPIGEPMPAVEITSIQRAFNGLLERNAQDGNKKKWDDTARKLSELYEKLATGQVSRESCYKVKELANCIDRGDFGNASRLRVELSATDWERNRSWLFAVQLLLPK